MFDTATATPLTLSGATVITPEGPVQAAFAITAVRLVAGQPVVSAVWRECTRVF